MKVKIKKLDEMAQIPKYAKDTDAGMDLVAVSREEGESYVEYGTGLAMEIPEGHVGLIFPRSSISNQSLVLANSVGVIDSGYRGEVKCRFKKVRHGKRTNGDNVSWSCLQDNNEIYLPSDKVAQIIILPYPKVEFEVTEELAESARGAGGFGSTGK